VPEILIYVGGRLVDRAESQIDRFVRMAMCADGDFTGRSVHAGDMSFVKDI